MAEANREVGFAIQRWPFKDWYAGTADKVPIFGEIAAVFLDENQAATRAMGLSNANGNGVKYAIVPVERKERQA